MAPVKIRLGDRSYEVVVERGLSALPGKIAALGIGTDAAVVTNPKIKALFGRKLSASLRRAGLRHRFILVPDSEKAKSLGQAMRLLSGLSKMDGKGKRPCVVAFGGGVVGDVAGFAASAYKRGIPYIQIPTTLLAQVDSSIGGKVAVDLPEGKNLVGSFYQPRLVYADISLLKGLSRRDFVSGLAEVIKYSIIKDRVLFGHLVRNRRKILSRDPAALMKIVSVCARIKAGIVSSDEREKKSLRTALNYGHSVGHAIEAAFGYSKAYSHGEAVALGMIAAGRISHKMGHLSCGELDSIEKLICSFGLPVTLKRNSLTKIMKALSYDKKFIRGKNRFVLPVNIGKVIVKEGIPEELIRNEIRNLFD